MRGTTREEEDGVTSFSDNLLISEDVLSSGNVGEDSFGFGFNGEDSPQMLCFGGGNQIDPKLFFSEPASLLSLHNNACACAVDDNSSRSNKKKNGSGDGHDRVCGPKPGKRSKRDQMKTLEVKAKVKKEKVSERITALQQLVSPYGKTDTASVLHETMGYIKFLQEQVQVLSSPYFKHHPLVLDEEDIGDVNPMMKVKDLKSNGLCLVPIACTVHVANNNGADLWSPAILSSTVNQ